MQIEGFNLQNSSHNLIENTLEGVEFVRLVGERVIEKSVFLNFTSTLTLKQLLKKKSH